MDDSKNEYANQLQKTNELQVREDTHKKVTPINLRKKTLLCIEMSSMNNPPKWNKTNPRDLKKKSPFEPYIPSPRIPGFFPPCWCSLNTKINFYNTWYFLLDKPSSYCVLPLSIPLVFFLLFPSFYLSLCPFLYPSSDRFVTFWCVFFTCFFIFTHTQCNVFDGFFLRVFYVFFLFFFKFFHFF